MKEYTVKVYENRTTWYLNGKLHREYGPAVERNNGSKAWYLNNRLHREDGPAIEDVDGNKKWFLHGVELTESEFNAKVKKEMTIAEIEEQLGYSIKIVK